MMPAGDFSVMTDFTSELPIVHLPKQQQRSHSCAILNSNCQQPHSKDCRKAIMPTVPDSQLKWKAESFLHGIAVLPPRNRQLLEIRKVVLLFTQLILHFLGGWAVVTTPAGAQHPHWTQHLTACFGEEASVPLSHIRCEHPNIQTTGQTVQRLLPEMLACVRDTHGQAGSAASPSAPVPTAPRGSCGASAQPECQLHWAQLKVILQTSWTHRHMSAPVSTGMQAWVGAN